MDILDIRDRSFWQHNFTYTSNIGVDKVIQEESGEFSGKQTWGNLGARRQLQK